MYVLNNEEMKAVETHAMKEYSVQGLLLMEHAASAVTEKIFELECEKILIVCGRGNNGGDGFCVARQLYFEGKNVEVLLFGQSEIRGDAKINYDSLKHLIEIDEVTELESSKQFFYQADVIVDALFGTGLDREVTGIYKEVISLINDSKAVTVSVDMPSGVNGSTGHIMGCAVKADYTIGFDAYKYGHLLYPGTSYCGITKIVPIGIPIDSYKKNECQSYVITEEFVKKHMIKRSSDAHKGSFLKVAALAGSVGMEGAAALVCKAAMRSGVGLMNLLMIEDIHQIVKSIVPEIISSKCDSSYLKTSGVLIAGPGCGQSEKVKEVLEHMLSLDKPLILDADALNVLSNDLTILDNHKAEIIMTPHIGEMSRLTGLTSKEILDNPVEIAKNFAMKHQVTLVLKSARTIIALKDGSIYINNTGNSGMATAGMGDVLVGIASALISQGVSVEMAGVLGVYLHGKSGDYVKDIEGTYGLLASDVANMIGKVMKEYSE